MRALGLPVLLFWSTTGFAQLKVWPEFKMAYAHDQEQVTPEVISAENQELEAYDRWLELKYQSDEAQDRLDRVQRKSRRYGILVKNNFVSLDNVAITQYQERKAQNEFKRHPLRIQKARAQLEFQRLRVISKGNPGRDVRQEMIEALLDIRRAERLALDFDLDTAEFGRHLTEIKVKLSKTLVDHQILSKADMEEREDLLEDFETDIRNTHDHMARTDEMIFGLERDLASITRTANR